MAKQLRSMRIPSTLKGYRIRESRRAKHVSIRVSTWGEVEVVVPPGFSVDQLMSILEQRQSWIQKTQARIQSEREAIAHETTVSHPHEIVLRSVDETWQVIYDETDDRHVEVHVDLAQNHLHIRGQIDQTALCQNLLGKWLRDYARYRLAPWLIQVSQETGLDFNRLSIRRQKTRWASCSNQNNISLNDKLLFLPTELVRYVLIHELCHTIHLNHSPQFWELVYQQEPNYEMLDRELRTAWRYIPRWLEH